MQSHILPMVQISCYTSYFHAMQHIILILKVFSCVELKIKKIGCNKSMHRDESNKIPHDYIFSYVQRISKTIFDWSIVVTIQV